MPLIRHGPGSPLTPSTHARPRLGVRRVETLTELLSQAIVLSCHCPLTTETRHIINAAAIEQMPMGSYVINTSRGGGVDVAAIPAAGWPALASTSFPKNRRPKTTRSWLPGATRPTPPITG